MKRALATTEKILLAIIFLPLAAMAGLLSAVFGLREKRSAAEVTTYLRNFVDGGGGEWDWDDFISVPIADPYLDDVRKRAQAVELPPTDEGMMTFRELLAEVERHPLL